VYITHLFAQVISMLKNPKNHNTTLIWTCEHCGKEIADGDGYVFINERLVYRFVDEKNSSNISSTKPASNRLCWEISHSACDPDPSRDTYWIRVKDLRSTEGFMSWTKHLRESKAWFLNTNWNDLYMEKALKLAHQ